MNPSQWQDQTAIRRCLEGKRIAIVGLSSNPARPSFSVAEYLLQAGYGVVPVNPSEQEILGQTCYPNLESIPGGIDFVDVFRRSDEIMPIAQSAVAINAKGLWLQLGIYHPEALEFAQQAGLACIADLCTKVEHRRLSIEGLLAS